MAQPAAAPRTLDTPLKQVLVKFEGEDLWWHHRLLLLQGPTPGLWIGAPPDEEVRLIAWLSGFQKDRVLLLEQGRRLREVREADAKQAKSIGSGEEA